MSTTRLAWDEYFGAQALLIANRATCKRAKVGAVLVKDNKVIATGYNGSVSGTEHCLDQECLMIDGHCARTLHAEVNAIRTACQRLRTFKLDDCEIFCSCEPCPMCLSALYWAGVKRICYGNTKADAKAIDFDDSFIYDQLDLGYDQRSIRCEHFLRDEAQKAFRKWQEKSDKIPY